MGKYIRAILLSSLAALLVGCSGGTSTPNANEITMCGNQSITFNNYYEEHIQLCIKENNPIFQVTYSASNFETGEESPTPQYVTQIKKYW